MGEGGHFAIGGDELTSQVGNGPEEEQNTQGRKQGRHDVDAKSYLGGVARKLRKEVACQHEEGGARGVSHLKFVGGGDKLWAIPETCRGLYRRTVGESRNGKGEPSKDVIHQIVLFHNEQLIPVAKTLIFKTLNIKR